MKNNHLKKQWKIKELSQNLPDIPDYPEMILKLLVLRDLHTEPEINNFLNPDYTKLLDPYLFKDMERSVKRILRAIEKNESILIYADYDADAVTALAVVYLGLKKLGANLTYYIPDRFTEGYGLNVEAIKKIAANGASLVITVDCGINATLEAKILKEAKIDLIITDHHELTGVLPEAFAVINPKNPRDQYPFSYLTGVGVAYKLIQALYTKFEIPASPVFDSEVAQTRGAGGRNSPASPRRPASLSRKRGEQVEAGKFEITKDWHKWLLDLVAIGTVADCQNLTGENRILVGFGLKVLKKTIWPGLKALIKTASVDSSKIDTYTLGFIIAPRINAAGRIAHANTAFELLISGDQKEAEKLAEELNQLNSHRQNLTEQILSEARSQVELLGDKKILMISGDNWPKGIVGLVAGRLVEEYGRPVLVIEKGEKDASGSARSINSFNIVAALNDSAKFLQKYGGHHQAAGFRLETKNIESFYKRLLEYADKNLSELDLTPVLSIDLELKPEDLTWENYDLLENFEPFGVGNLRPRFAAYGLKVLGFRTVGGDDKHLKLQVGFGQLVLEAIAFRQGYWGQHLSVGAKIDVVFELSANEWNGNKELQLKIVDLKIESN